MYEKYPIHISQLKVIFDTLKLITTKRKINPTEAHNSLPMSIPRRPRKLNIHSEDVLDVF